MGIEISFDYSFTLYWFNRLIHCQGLYRQCGTLLDSYAGQFPINFVFGHSDMTPSSAVPVTFALFHQEFRQNVERDGIRNNEIVLEGGNIDTERYAKKIKMDASNGIR